jgi:nucleoside phosphorylase
VVGLVAALRDEVTELRRRLELRPAASPHGARLFRGQVGGQDVVLAQSGSGRENAERATRFLLRRYPLQLVVALGFAGGLSPALLAGELVLCMRLRCQSVPEGLCRPHPGFLSVAARCAVGEPLRLRLGNSVTVARLSTTPLEKRQLGECWDAQAADRESFWIARAAAEGEVPFLALRAITDPLGFSPPPLDRLLAPDGSVDWWKAAGRFLTHPAELARLPRVGLNAAVAARNLAEFAGALLARL